MQLFAKRVWGFDPENWPLVVFGKPGNCDALCRQAKAGDRVILVGTQGDETAVENQGRVLGMAEFDRTVVKTADVVPPEERRPVDYDENGELKWPVGLPMVRAWAFPTRPRVTEVLAEQLSFEATVRAVLLNDVDGAAILALPSEELAVPNNEVLNKRRAHLDALRSLRPTTGPAPAAWSTTVTRTLGDPAFLYAARFGGLDVWKVGWSGDVAARIAAFNEHVPHEVLNKKWTLFLQQRRDDEVKAHSAEQALLALLHGYRSVGERVLCSEKVLRSAWSSALLPSSR